MGYETGFKHEVVEENDSSEYDELFNNLEEMELDKFDTPDFNC